MFKLTQKIIRYLLYKLILLNILLLLENENKTQNIYINNTTKSII